MFTKVPVVLLHRLEDMDPLNKKSNAKAAACLDNDKYRKANSDTDKSFIGSNDTEKFFTKIPVILLHRLEDLDALNKKSNVEAAAYLGDNKYRKAYSDTDKAFIRSSDAESTPIREDRVGASSEKESEGNDHHVETEEEDNEVDDRPKKKKKTEEVYFYYSFLTKDIVLNVNQSKLCSGNSLGDFECGDILKLNSQTETRLHDVKNTKNTLPTESSDFNYIDALKKIADPRDHKYLNFNKMTEDSIDFDYFQL